MSAYGLRAGDVVATSGGDWLTCIIERCSCAFPWTKREYQISHVGVVAPNPDNHDEMLWWESSMGLPKAWRCAVQGKVVKGVQASRIQARLDLEAATGGTVWHWPLARPLDALQTRELLRECWRLKGTPYDYSGAWTARKLGFGWAGHLFGRLGLLPGYYDNHKLFCVEFVATLHSNTGVCEFKYPSHWNPSAFVHDERELGIVKGPNLVIDRGKWVAA